MNVGIVKKWDQLKGWGFISDLNDAYQNLVRKDSAA